LEDAGEAVEARVLEGIVRYRSAERAARAVVQHDRDDVGPADGEDLRSATLRLDPAAAAGREVDAGHRDEREVERDPRQVRARDEACDRRDAGREEREDDEPLR